jgi:hypothetical protein
MNGYDAMTITPKGNGLYNLTGSRTYTGSGTYIIRSAVSYSDDTADDFVDIVTVAVQGNTGSGVILIGGESSGL